MTITVSKATSQFNGWVDSSTQAGHITGPNAYHIKQAFQNAITTQTTPVGASHAFIRCISTKISTHLKNKKSCGHIISAAKKAIFGNLGAVTHDGRAWKTKFDGHTRNVTAQKGMLRGIYTQ